MLVQRYLDLYVDDLNYAMASETTNWQGQSRALEGQELQYTYLTTKFHYEK
jgi:hypothetical protein